MVNELRESHFFFCKCLMEFYLIRCVKGTAAVDCHFSEYDQVLALGVGGFLD